MNAPLRQMTKTMPHFLYHPTRISGVTGVLQLHGDIANVRRSNPERAIARRNPRRRLGHPRDRAPVRLLRKNGFSPFSLRSAVEDSERPAGHHSGRGRGVFAPAL